MGICEECDEANLNILAWIGRTERPQDVEASCGQTEISKQNRGSLPISVNNCTAIFVALLL